MTSEDPKISEFHSLKPTNYNVLTEFSVRRLKDPDDQVGTHLTMRLWSEGMGASAIEIDFATVIEMCVNSLNKLNGYLLEIQPIQDKKWDDGHYAVSDVGQNAFSFVCKDFKVRRVGYSANTLYCSFCGKSKEEVKKLVAGPNVYICNECADLCVEINTEEK